MAISREERIFWGEFIDIYKEHPCIWKVKSSEYSDKNKKGAAYDVLVRKLKEKDDSATRDTVTKKINNLRSAFRKEHKKVISSLRSGTSADDVYQPSLWYYEQLLFLQDQEIPRQSVTNVMVSKC